jgi:hypothetical protein
MKSSKTRVLEYSMSHLTTLQSRKIACSCQNTEKVIRSLNNKKVDKLDQTELQPVNTHYGGYR